MSPPQLSPDPKFYLDGQRWQPMPPAQSKGMLSVTRTGWTIIFVGLIVPIVGGAILALLSPH